jgi:uncharacterized protein (DUF2141 family)
MATAYHTHPDHEDSMTRSFRTILFAAPLALTLSAHAATVEVHLSGVDAGKGKVSVAVCDQAHFLKQCIYTASVPAKSSELTVPVTGVPAGTWAVMAYQDVNENGELDRYFFGLPKENYGFSRDARGKFGPPSFDDASIAVKDDGGPTVAAVRLH